MLGVEWYVLIMGVVIAMAMAGLVYLTVVILWWLIKWLEK